MGDDDFWGGTNPSDVSIDTANSKEIMAGSHITEQNTFEFRGSVQSELLNMTSYKPHEDDLSQNYDLDFLVNFNDWNLLLKVNDITNSGANTTNNNIVNQ